MLFISIYITAALCYNVLKSFSVKGNGAMSYTVGIYTLGCKVSQYESIAISERFEALGYKVMPFESECDIYVINTCTVTAESDRKCRQIIRRATSRKKPVFVCGCYSQVAPQDIAKIEGVTYISGNYNKTKIPDIAHKMLSERSFQSSPTIDVCDIDSCEFEPMCIKSAPRTRVYVKIEDGCESRCTYCIIPAARGKIRSKLPEDILSEVSELAKSGVKEVVLTGIETASYGKDLGDIRLIDIIEKIAKIGGIERIRLGSLDPSSINEDFVIRASKEKKLCPHFHLSLQSGSSTVLARMKRKYNADQAMAKIDLIRSYIKDATFTTDVMVGFPGETPEEFSESIEFAKKARFLFMHIFPYSKRSGTLAAKYDGQIEESEKHRRVNELSAVRDTVSKEVTKELVKIGCEIDVLFETYDGEYLKGHTANFIEIKAPSQYDMRSQIHTIKVTSNDNGICIGEILTKN